MRRTRLIAVVAMTGIALTALAPSALASGSATPLLKPPPLPPLGSQPAPTEEAAAPVDNLPGVPEPGASAAEWEAWVAADLADAHATDWSALAAERSCTVQQVAISLEVAPDYNTQMGAPANLATVRVDLVEDCPSQEPVALERSVIAPRAVPAGPSRCQTLSGKGTTCVYKQSGRIYASWKNSSGNSQQGFLAVYQISAAATGCPTGSSWHASGGTTWGNGVTRSTYKTQTQTGGYSAYMWRAAAVGHNAWGSTCAVL